MRGTHNTETPGCNILARFDPRPAGVHVGGRGVRGGGGGTMSQQYLEYFCPSSLLETSESDLYAGMGRFMGTGGVGGGGGGCSVTLVADWRKLIFIIQTDGALSEFVLWDDLTLLGSSVLRVSHESGGRGRG